MNSGGYKCATNDDRRSTHKKTCNRIVKVDNGNFSEEFSGGFSFNFLGRGTTKFMPLL